MSTPATTPEPAAPAEPTTPATPATVAIPAVTPAPAAPVTAPAAPAVVPPAKPEPSAGETPEAKQLREANDRIAKLEAANQVNLRKAVAAELGLAPGASEFLTATDEDGIRAQAEKLKAFAPAAPATPVTPPAAGSVTNPAPAAPTTIDERIAQAEKAPGYESITLKLAKMRGES